MYSRRRSISVVRIGSKKGAHYSLSRCAATGGALAGLAATLMWVLAASAAPAPGRPEADAKKTEQQLAAVKAEIERVTREVAASQVERDRMARELKGAELSVGDAPAACRHRQPARRARHREAHARERARRQPRRARAADTRRLRARAPGAP